MISIFRWAGKILPENVKGQIEYHLRPGLAEVWGGPFNGQCFRQRIVADVLRTFDPAAIVETGTFRGTSTHFLAMNSRAPIYSTEFSPRNLGFAQRRLRHFENVTLIQKDSREFLKQLQLSPGERPVLFYLDAHWNADLPLNEEVELILKKLPNFLILIDDFQVPDDPGYAYDDYGPGSALSLRDFPFDRDKRMSVYFPSCPSAEESGCRRGCILLASPGLSSRVERLGSLRNYCPQAHSIST